MRVYAVLSRESRHTLRGVLRKASPGSITLEFSENLTDSIQKMFLYGHPDLFIAECSLCGSAMVPTLKSLREQPGFAEMQVILLCEGHPTPPDIMEVSRMVLPPSPGPAAIHQALRNSFPTLFGDSYSPATEEPPAEPESRPDGRKAVRKEFSTPCLLWTGAKKIHGKLKDISLTGAKVHVEGDLNIQSLVTLNLAVPGNIPPKIIQFKAVVVRRDKAGYGLSFREMDQESRHFLKQFTQGSVFG